MHYKILLSISRIRVLVFYGITPTGNGTVISNGGQTFALQRETVFLTSYFSVKPENIFEIGYKYKLYTENYRDCTQACIVIGLYYRPIH